MQALVKAKSNAGGSKGKELCATGFQPNISYKRISSSDKYPTICIQYEDLIEEAMSRSALILIHHDDFSDILSALQSWDLPPLPKGIALTLAKKFLDIATRES